MSGHGSLTKVGKVRMNTPKISKTRVNPKHGPKLRLKTNYNRFLSENLMRGKRIELHSRQHREGGR